MIDLPRLEPVTSRWSHFLVGDRRDHAVHDNVVDRPSPGGCESCDVMSCCLCPRTEGFESCFGLVTMLNREHRTQGEIVISPSANVAMARVRNRGSRMLTRLWLRALLTPHRCRPLLSAASFVPCRRVSQRRQHHHHPSQQKYYSSSRNRAIERQRCIALARPRHLPRSWTSDEACRPVCHHRQRPGQPSLSPEAPRQIGQLLCSLSPLQRTQLL